MTDTTIVTPRMSAAEIIAEVAEEYGITVEVLKGKRHTRKLLPARQAVARRLRYERKLATTVIGRLMGGRDHSTILNYLDDERRARGRARAKTTMRKLREAAREAAAQ